METELDFVKRRLNADPRSIARIAEDSGAKRSWLEKFARGDIKSPGYPTVLHLYRYYKARRK